MRKTIICIVVASVSACSSEESADQLRDPACAGDEEAPASRTDDLPWDLDRDPVSDFPVCPADNPECDSIDADAPEEEDEIELHGATLEDIDRTPYGLTDPLTSTGKYHPWPNGRIPYAIGASVNATTRQRLSQAMTNWEQLTEGRIKFRKRAGEKAYVSIHEGSPKVSPFVGYRAGKVQTMHLRDSEFLTVIKHELGHVIGLHHEQKRSDRASFIKVRPQFIVNSQLCKSQFATCPTCKKLGTYDRVSVMHYRTHDLANCRTGNVLLKLDGGLINHVWKISAKDLTSVALMYKKPAPVGGGGGGPPFPLLPETGSLVGDALCTSIADRGVVAGQPIEVRACDGGGDQDWRLTADGQLRVQHSLQCAAVVGCSVDGAGVEQSACVPGALDQKWTFENMALVSGTAGTCLEARESGLGLAACADADAQRFGYRPETETIEHAGMCATANGDAITLAACDGSAAQKWFQGRGGFVTRTDTGRCLNASGTSVAIGECTDELEQRWAMRGAIRDSRSALCLHGGSTAGTKLALAVCDGSPSQLWTFWSR